MQYPAIIGKKFQVMFVEFSSEHIPYVSRREGDGIKSPAIYVRRGGQTSEASHEELQRIINQRIETKYSTSNEITLKQHMEQLKVLYSERSSNNPIFLSLAKVFAFRGPGDSDDDDSYNDFVKRTISIKKSIILKSIGATPRPLGSGGDCKAVCQKVDCKSGTVDCFPFRAFPSWRVVNVEPMYGPTSHLRRGNRSVPEFV